jgi:hypothetical protein
LLLTFLSLIILCVMSSYASCLHIMRHVFIVCVMSSCPVKNVRLVLFPSSVEETCSKPTENQTDSNFSCCALHSLSHTF